MFSLQPDIPSPRKLFATVSLLMIVAMLAVAGVTLAAFFRQTVLEREAGLVRDLVNALVSEHAVAPVDLSDYNEPASRDRLDRSFGPLRGLQDVQKIKVFNRDHTIIWSDDQQLIGTQRTAHLDHLLAALRGEVKAVFNPGIAASTIFDFGAPRPQNIEFYVPLYVPKANGGRDVEGALALYRSPERLNEDLWRGMTLLGFIVGGTCLLLFAALYWLFSIVHSKQQSIERQFTKLSADQNRLVQIEKMSAMGELVGQIAHQLNNPLIGVLNMTQLAEREADNPERVRELLAEVRKAGAECRDIIQRILRLNRSASSDPQLVNVAELIRDTIKFCHLGIHLDQPVNFICHAEDVTLFVDPVLVRHAIFNLIQNAVLAAPGSPIDVELSAEASDDVPGVGISVTDQGPGLSDEALRKIFTPFFTTRANGTGLGLPVARQIVMKQGGHVHGDNALGGGARFHIWLPTPPSQ